MGILSYFDLVVVGKSIMFEEVSVEIVKILLWQVEVELGGIDVIGVIIMILVVFNQMQLEVMIKVVYMVGFE